jgi:phenylacetate-CoA ligase
MPIRRSAKKVFSKVAWHAYNTHRKGFFYRSQLSKTIDLFNAPRETILKFQSGRLKQLIQHAVQTTPYYRDLFKDFGMKPNDLLQKINADSIDISQILPLEKQTIRKQLDNLCSELFPLYQRIENATGGSTGTPLKFYQDRAYWNQRNLSVYYFDRWAGWDFGEPQLIIWGALADVNGNGNWKQKLNRYWRNQHWLNGFHLTDSAMQTTFEKMQRWRPKTILAYPSSLYQFAKFLSDNNLTPKWKLKGIISSAEMLHPHYRSLAETVFETKIYNRYGGREVGLIAMECAEGRMHINCRDIYLEVDSPDPYTQPGEILITQFNNYIMPFIRYRIGDVGRLSDEMCPCGNQLPVLAELLGRSTATFKTKDGTLIHGGYFTQQFYNLAGVTQFQLIQETFEKCILKLVVNEQWREETKEQIVQKIKDALGAKVSVKIEFVDEIPLPKSGKREFTISKVT